MRLLLSLILGFVFALPCQSQSNMENLRKDVFALAADSMKGRLVGTVENRKAADYIVSEFTQIGIKSYLDTTYFHNFSIDETMGRNVLGVIEGTSQKDEYIVVGAHYDHIGYKVTDDGVMQIYNGADDNASGVAMMLEVARQVKVQPLSCSVIFIAFDAEESGLIGSEKIIADSLIPLDKLKIAFSLDMVGGLCYGKHLEYNGINGLKNWHQYFIVKSNDKLKVKYTKQHSPYIGTDSDSFTKAGVLGIYVNTGLLTPYHRPEDDADLIDYKGMVSVTNHFMQVLRNLGELKIH